MTLKRKITVNVSLVFTVIFGLSSTLIYVSFYNFRKEEFKNRLKEKAMTTAKLLLEVKEIDKQILESIDQNSINKLYNEKTLVFNSDYKLIYESLDNTTIEWTKADLVTLNREKLFFKSQSHNKELLGIYLRMSTGDYYVLITAEDNYGYSKLRYLLYSLIITYCIGIILVWLFIYIFVQKLLRPLDTFQQQITSITANQLNIHLEENNSNDEINLLTRAFNQMLTRLEDSFTTQKEFTANASHELYTPLTRISLQLENLIQLEQHSENTQKYLKSINNDVHHIADLIDSLLILAKANKEDIGKKFRSERLDEIMFDAMDQVKKIHSGFNLEFDIQLGENLEKPMEIKGIKSLLKIAFFNLLKNAYAYSSDKRAVVLIKQFNDQEISVIISNNGKTVTAEEQKKMFDPFMRGVNSGKTSGSGLGLPIVKRILNYHNATISYTISNEQYNQFLIVFLI
ncbi:HAMP domain-containing histidine kinase [Flavobacterium silvisoli]|uniref:histidine kinase n=1 Tax=Flavobacterium silvisoli TaxID=2529433 RepID=A0A4Q9Z7R9_9FLAO|nr:HAMP domain-containing sensor histidine kinase [Flavobacterium silvisoli]TBX70745.1 HAMP domain-containing histidine kinase [Flavobacterium silvisoli]